MDTLDMERSYDDDDLYIIPIGAGLVEAAYWLVAEGYPDHCVGVFEQLEDAVAFVEERQTERKKSHASIRVHYLLEHAEPALPLATRIQSLCHAVGAPDGRGYQVA